MTDHLRHEDLLMYLDGELSRGAVRTAASHIRSCWSCATEFERLKKHIGLILDAQNEVLFPALPPAPAPWPLLDPRLASAAQPRKPNSFAWKALRRPVWTTAAVAAAAIVATVVWVTPAPVSAKALLQRIAENDGPRLAASSGHFVRQRVRVVRTQRRTRQTISGEVDSWRSVSGNYWKIDRADSAGAGLQAHYREKNLSELPLSPAVYRAWSDDAGGKATVSRHAGTLELKVAAAGGGDRTEVHLWTDPVGWHVTRMELRFPDDDFDIQERELSVLPRRDVPPDVLAHLEPSSPAAGKRADSANSVPEAGSSGVSLRANAPDLEATEIDVLFTLHEVGADLGEPVEVEPESNGQILVRMWGVAPERRDLLIQLLKGKPGVEIQQELPSSAGVSTIPPSNSPVSFDAPAPAPTTRERSADEERLVGWFGGAQVQEGFTRSALADATALLSRLYALKRLATRWPPPDEAALPEASREKLAAMVEDHTHAAEQQCSGLEFILKPLLDAFSPSVGIGGAPAKLFPNWQNSAGASLDAAKSLDRMLRGLLTTSDAALPLDRALPLVRAKLDETRDEIEAILRPSAQ